MNENIEFSRPLDVMRLPAGGGYYEIAASADERAALARRFELLALDRLEAKVRVERIPGGFYRLSAELDAAPVQACAVTLEPVSNRINESFSLLYGPIEEEEEIVLDGAAETVEALDDGVIDLGEAVAQQLSLALDPFPLSPEGAAQNGTISTGEVERASPFAVLAKLRKTKEH
jgi:uncharacterized metal-binding protein YceD (DUF177 family)